LPNFKVFSSQQLRDTFLLLTYALLQGRISNRQAQLAAASIGAAKVVYKLTNLSIITELRCASDRPKVEIRIGLSSFAAVLQTARRDIQSVE
jgi:hypothetical protein